MIEGIVTERLDAMIRIGLKHTSGATQVVDTGFSGCLTLPRSIIDSLELPWMYRQQGMLADGSRHTFDVYVAVVLWNGEERTIEVEEANIEPLVGMELARGSQLNIHVVPGGTVRIEPT
jgi:clan AA aspartic protease